MIGPSSTYLGVLACASSTASAVAYVPVLRGAGLPQAPGPAYPGSDRNGGRVVVLKLVLWIGAHPATDDPAGLDRIDVLVSEELADGSALHHPSLKGKAPARWPGPFVYLATRRK